MVAPLNCGADLPAFWYWRYLDQYWPKFCANCFPWFLEEIEIDQYPLAAVVRTTSAPFRLHARWIFPLSIRRNLGEMTKPLVQTCRRFAKRIWIFGCLAQAWRQVSKSVSTDHDSAIRRLQVFCGFSCRSCLILHDNDTVANIYMLIKVEFEYSS